jgi:hypothetical protein
VYVNRKGSALRPNERCSRRARVVVGLCASRVLRTATFTAHVELFARS